MTDSIYTAETPTFNMEQALGGDFPCIVLGPLRAIFWCEVIVEPCGDLEIECLSVFPFPYVHVKSSFQQHCVPYEIENMGLQDICGVGDCWGAVESLATWMLQEGIQPNQPFQIDVSCWYTGPDFQGEYDSGMDVEILKVAEVPVNIDWIEAYFQKSLEISTDKGANHER